MTPESKLKAETTGALKQLGYRVYRIQCGRWKVRGGWMHGAKAGTPDTFVPVLLSNIAKAILWIEFKVDTKQRPEQVEFQRNLAHGEYYVLARSLDDVLGWLKVMEARA